MKAFPVSDTDAEESPVLKAGDPGTALWLIEQLKTLDPAAAVWIVTHYYPDGGSEFDVVRHLEPYTDYPVYQKGVFLCE